MKSEKISGMMPAANISRSKKICIPTLLVFKGGQVADRSVGLVSPQEILDLVK